MSERTTIDLTPDPRVLRMLGEIELAQWQCVAELIDNSIDAFVKTQRADGVSPDNPHIIVSLPTRIDSQAVLTIRDNGPGMSVEELERALRAGWSGNNPTDALGMFGMGFNIATARLGGRTTVWSTRSIDQTWRGVVIDFDEMSGASAYERTLLIRGKSHPVESGTEIEVSRIKAEQLRWLTQRNNQGSLRRKLERVYSSMLRHNGDPLTVRVDVNSSSLSPWQHCVWSEERVVEHRDYGEISAVQPFNVQLGERPYCMRCWTWLAPHEGAECLQCGKADHVISRKRAVRGWVAIQRYCDQNDYGIDFIRNGRVIEVANKELFRWEPEDGTPELEYPVDDVRSKGGRIVGEVHLDHCRVHYTKDAFERTDPAWTEMKNIVRGPGPLRPRISHELGITPSTTPLFLLYQAFRRNTPHSTAGGGWERILMVEDNARAKRMAAQFRKGDLDFQADVRWYELVQEQDTEASLGGNDGGLEDVADPLEDDQNGGLEGDQQYDEAEEVEYREDPLASLSQTYVDSISGRSFEVKAHDVDMDHPLLQTIYGRKAWVADLTTRGVVRFFVARSHPVFASASLTPKAVLLAEIARLISELESQVRPDITFGSVLPALRSTYAADDNLVPSVLQERAQQVLQLITDRLQSTLDGNAVTLWEALSDLDRDNVVRRSSNNSECVESGEYLRYLEPVALLELLAQHPGAFFDGRVWDDQYLEIEGRFAEEQRRRTLYRRAGILADVIQARQLTDVPAGRPHGHLSLQRLWTSIQLLELETLTE